MKTQWILCLGIGIASALAVSAAEQKQLGYKDTPIIPGTKCHVHDGDRLQPPIVTPGKTVGLMAPAQSDAVVLFDGKDFSKWRGRDGDVKWKIEDNYMETTSTGVIRTKDEFGDFQMHLEFATPAKVEGSGQGRGNNEIGSASWRER